MFTNNTCRTVIGCVTAGLLAAIAIGCSSSSKSCERICIEKEWEKPLTREEEAQNTIKQFKRDDPGLKKFFDTAQGYVVFPAVGKGGFIVGGARGDGVVYEKGKVIGYATLTQGTVGAQIGGQVFAEIIFLEDRAAMLHFQQGNAEFAAQATAVAVTSGASAKADYAKGVAIFIRGEKGLMAEASIGGQGFEYTPK